MNERQEKPILRKDASLPTFSEDFNPKEEYERSATLIRSIEEWLDQNSHFEQFHDVSLDGSDVVGEHFLDHPQIASMLTIVPRTPNHNPDYGLLHPEDKIIIGKRSLDSSWGADTWAIPMGKIDPEDIRSSDASVEEVVGRAANRELHEEVLLGDVIKEPTSYIGAFKDSQTGFTIHSMIKPILKPGTETNAIRVDLPDLREHSDLGWAYLKDLPHLGEMSDGMKYLIKKFITYVAQRNTEYSKIYARREI